MCLVEERSVPLERIFCKDSEQVCSLQSIEPHSSYISPTVPPSSLPLSVSPTVPPSSPSLYTASSANASVSCCHVTQALKSAPYNLLNLTAPISLHLSYHSSQLPLSPTVPPSSLYTALSTNALVR
jgi:hypothetical protein